MSEVKRYTLAEVASKNGRSGAPIWLVYKDSVYDVTKYINEHPGGDVIMEEAGKDATKVFDSSHSSDAKSIMAKLKIGEIVEEEKVYDANGKKKRKVIQVEPEVSSKSCLSICTCGLLG